MIAKKLSLIIAACCIIIAMGAGNVSAQISGYVGAGLGAALSSFDEAHAIFEAPDLSPSETSWRIFGGLQLCPNLGVEAGYVGLGTAKLTIESPHSYFEDKATGYDLTALGYLPLVGNLTAFARGGIMVWSTDMTWSMPDADSTGNKSGTNLTLGFGGQYIFGRSLGVRAEYTRYAIDKAKAGLGDFNVLSANVFFAFGRK